jgi:hypothetical protein
MSVAIATGGMFRDCCGIAPAGGGGAPPVNQYAEQYDDRVKFSVMVNKVFFRDTKIKDKKLKVLIKQISIDDF